MLLRIIKNQQQIQTKSKYETGKLTHYVSHAKKSTDSLRIAYFWQN